MSEQFEGLGTVYVRDGNVVRTGIFTMEYSVPPEEIVLPDMKAIYVSSKTVAGLEVIYGSVLHAIDEAVRPIYRTKRLLRKSHETNEQRGWNTGNAIEYGKNVKSWELSPGAYTDAVLHRQEEILKDALLLTGVHVRTLLEDFSGIGNVPVAVYDREDSAVGTVSLAAIFHTLAHYRYCVVSGAFVHDVFSRKGQLGIDQLVGSKLRTVEVFDAVFESISKIRVSDFVGLLWGRLESLSVNSARRDAIFAVQNVEAIARIVGERATADGEVPKFMQFLVSQMTTEQEGVIPDTEFVNIPTGHWSRRTGIPSFQVGHTLRNKTIQVDLCFGEDGQRKVTNLRWDDFFRELVKAHGEEPLVLPGVLRSRFEAMDGLGR